MSDYAELENFECPQCGYDTVKHGECDGGCINGEVDALGPDIIILERPKKRPCPKCGGLNYIAWCNSCGLIMDEDTVNEILEQVIS